MFEGKPPRRAMPARSKTSARHRRVAPLSWGDLVARLSAARELRSSRRPDAAGEASFDAGSARRIAAHHNGKQDVNLDVSGNGKGPRAQTCALAFAAEPRAMRK
jgi:hypothetical protein